MVDENQQSIENTNSLAGEQPVKQEDENLKDAGNDESPLTESIESTDQQESNNTEVAVAEKKDEMPSWMVGKMSKKIKTEVERAVTGAMQTLLQLQNASQQQQQPQATVYNQDPMQNTDPVPQQPDVNAAIDNYFAKKQQEQMAMKQEAKMKSFNAQIDAARDRFDDYDEFVNDASPYFTAPMLALMTEIPGSVENFKLAWDTDKNSIMNISKLPPIMQVAELKRVLDDVSTKQSTQKYKPSASTPISPIKSTSTDATKDKSSFSDLVKRRYQRVK